MVCHGTKGTFGSTHKFHANPRIVEILLEHGASVHAKDDFGHTPLQDACESGNLEIVQTLIQHNADVDAISENVDGKHFTPLMIAAGYGFSEIAKELLKYGADVNFSNSYGNSLHLTTKYGHSEIVKILLKNRCNANVRAKLDHDNNELINCTAFELALDIKSMGIVKMIAFHEI